MTYFVGTGIACFAILMIIEYRLLSGLIYGILGACQQNPPSESADGFMDVDVYNEKQRVNTMTTDDIKSSNLVLRQMSKFYRRVLAVNQISIGIHE